VWVSQNQQSHQCSSKVNFLPTADQAVAHARFSRARHGMYIIGDSETARVVPMWASIIRMLEEKGNIGRTLELQCPRHPDISIPISTTRDFAWLAPNGGCLKRCKDLLACGHVCPMRCHSDQQHER